MKTFGVSLLAILGVAAQVHASTLWNNPIIGPNPSSANCYTDGQTVGANLTVSGIGRGAGLNASDGSDRYNASGWETPSWGSAVLDTTNYFYFILTPDSGFALNLTSFIFSAQASKSGPTGFEFRSSADGFANSLGMTNTSETLGLISLAGAQFQGLSGIEFRFYGFGTDDVGGTFSIDEFIFTGEIVPTGPAGSVPESGPGLAALACVLVALALAKNHGVFPVRAVAFARVKAKGA